eukprot:GFYU01007407.1.p1 GENE.GFYU01007407.1~~GFYU01007407.1.p1  ORF type:complete len:308 (-),score=45.65 GFYU01007407.1:617-1540(-)
MTSGQNVVVVFGGSGWLGGLIVQYLQMMNSKLSDPAVGADVWRVVSSQYRLEQLPEIARQLEEEGATHVINAAGLTGRPNVDWCEDHKQETIRVNVVGALQLADVCESRGIHLTYFGTGCLYQFDKTHTETNGVGYTEADKPNFDGSFYSKTKGIVNEMLSHYGHVLNLRFRMPITADTHPRNFVTKITSYSKVISIQNSVSVIPDLLPLCEIMMRHRVCGAYNFVNPGSVCHNDILQKYKEIVAPQHQYETITLNELHGITKAQRSNAILDTTKIMSIAAKYDYKLPHIDESLPSIMEGIKSSTQR